MDICSGTIPASSRQRSTMAGSALTRTPSASNRSALPQRLARRFHGLYLFLLNKWYFDELYDLIFVRPALWLGRLLWKVGDGLIIAYVLSMTGAVAPWSRPTTCTSSSTAAETICAGVRRMPW